MLNDRGMNNVLIIGIDFDGTCVTHDYPFIGEDIGAVSVLKKLVDNGHKLVLNTMRGNSEIPTKFGTVNPLKESVKWFKDNEIELFGINYTPGQDSWTDSPKVYADRYIDDAAIGVPLVYYNGRWCVDWVRVEQYLVDEGII